MNHWIIRWGLSFVSIAVLYYLVDKNNLSFVEVEIGLSDVLMLSLLTGSNWFLRCLRLSLILKSTGRSPGLLVCFLAQALEVCGNLLVPFRGGDLGRVALLSRQSQGGYKTQVFAYFFEKLVELFLSILVLLVFFPRIWIEISRFLDLENLVIVIVFSALFLVVAGITGYFQKILGFFTKISGLTLSLAVQPLIWSVLITLLMRFLSALVFYILANVAGINIGLAEMVFVVSVVMLACSIPAAPGFIGTYQLAVVFALSLLSVIPDESIMYSVILHTWQMMTWLAMGVVGVLLYQLSGISRGARGENSIS